MVPRGGVRGGSRAAATSKMERFVIIVNGLAVVNYYHKALHLGYCSSPRSASGVEVGRRLKLCFYQKDNQNFHAILGKTMATIF